MGLSSVVAQWLPEELKASSVVVATVLLDRWPCSVGR